MKAFMLMSGIWLLCALSMGTSATNTPLKRVCYYVNDVGSLPADRINASLCTHIIFAFANVINETVVPEDSSDVEVYKQLMDLKVQSPELKVMISIASFSPDPGLPNAASTKESRQRFINNALAFLQEHGFDGLDIDWEFPGMGGESVANVWYFSCLLTDFRAAISALSPEKPRPLLTAAVSASVGIILISYKIPAMAKSVDFINLMGYDYYFYQSTYPLTQHNSPLYGHFYNILYFGTQNIDFSAYFWAQKGMPKEKICVGLPTYGRTYTLLSEDVNGLLAPASGTGSGGGTLTYSEVCKLLQSGATRVFDDDSMVPYAYLGKDWASYDDVESFTAKANFIIQEGYAGSMTWSLNNDDWNGTCGAGLSFPLHQVLKKILSSP